MSESLSRRQFLGATAAGGVLLAGQLAAGADPAPAETADWAAPLPPVTIHKVYIGRTGGIYLSRPTDEIQKFEAYLANLEKKLGDVKFVGGETIPPADVAAVAAKARGADALLLFHLCGHGGDAPPVDVLAGLGMPTAVFSQPYSGHGWMDFPAWQKAGKPVVVLPTSDWGELDQIVGLMRVGPHMKRTKILAIGKLLGTDAACLPEKIKEVLGTEVVSIEAAEVIDAHQAVPLVDAQAEAESYWISQAKKIVEPSRDEVVSSARLYLAVKKLMQKYGARAVTSSHCMGAPAKGCFTFSKLNDLGLVGACEGDIDSTLTMLLFGYAFGRPGFITDPVFDTAQNALIHFHCTCATKMDGPAGKRFPFTIRNQGDSDQGVALDVEMRVDQPVTCAKFVNLDTMLLSTGTIRKVTHDELGCRTQFVTEVADARRMFHNWGGGVLAGGTMARLHRAVFYGDHTQSIAHLGTLMGFKVVAEG